MRDAAAVGVVVPLQDDVDAVTLEQLEEWMMHRHDFPSRIARRERLNSGDGTRINSPRSAYGARAAALDAEAGSERRLAHADHCPLADRVQRIAQADGRRRLALARRRRRDGRDEDELAFGVLLNLLDQLIRELSSGSDPP
jgi:hypothetical protein